MNIRHAYNQWSNTYDQDRNLTRDLDNAVTRKFLHGRHFGSVLELGCGTGKNTMFLSGISSHLHALDFSQGMLEVAKQKIPSGHVHFEVADLTQPWPCADQAYDFMSCSLVLEHIKDLRFIFSEANRCLKEGGELYVSEFHPFRQYQGGKARYQEAGDLVEVDAYVHHVSEFLAATRAAGLECVELDEHWHEEDIGKPPRLLTILFKKNESV